MPSLKDAGSLDAVPSNVDEVGNINGSVNGTTTEKSESPSCNRLSAEVKNGGVPDEEFDVIESEDAVLSCTFSNLIKRMRDLHYNKNWDEVNLVNMKCRLLFERDYKIQVVENDVCANYPKEILVPVSKKNIETNCVNFDAELYRDLVKHSKVARLRCRYVTPVILFEDKFICRSGTLCVWTSAFFEKVKGSIPSILDIVRASLNPTRSVLNLMSETYESAQFIISEEALKKQHAKDVEILKHLKVGRICDLMVEYNKHYRDLVNVSSTEKVNEDIYKGIKTEEMPFPGCEFFTKYCKAERKPDGLVFDWNQSDVTRTLVLTEDPKLFFPDMDIENFKEWDLVCLTQNYLKIILSYLLTGTDGILVHCISGWDRTPLFVSLIRLSLWADGVIHASLKYEDMAYLTVAYDWYLFGHNLPDRLSKKEEVMHFCFNFLQHITSDEFSITRMFKELDPEITKDRCFPIFVPERRKCLNDIRDYVMQSYDAHILNQKNEQSWLSGILYRS